VTAPAGLELASNYHQTRAHYSNNLASASSRPQYRMGYALCDTEAVPVVVFDDAYHRAFWPRVAKSAASLPLCKRCERKAAKRAEVADV
jgi:hypothetical protein